MPIATGYKAVSLTREELRDEVLDVRHRQPLGLQRRPDGTHIDVGIVVHTGRLGRRSIDNAEIEFAHRTLEDLVVQDLVDLVVRREGDDGRPEPIKLFRLYVALGRDDQFVADLAGARRGAVQDTATRAGLTEDDVGR